MWFPYNIPSSISINSSFIIDSLNHNEYKLPSTVMKTAMRPLDVNGSLEFELDTGDPSLEFYVYMHFAELEKLQSNQHREFDVELNGNLWAKSIVPEYLHSKTVVRNEAVRGNWLKFSIYKTLNSTLPPILNAMEIYVVRDFLQAPTDQEYGTAVTLHLFSCCCCCYPQNHKYIFLILITNVLVNAIMDIKSSYGIGKSWQGDPCEPVQYSWDGLNCSYKGYDSPIITSL